MEKNMRNGTCPKCQSTAVYMSDAENLQAPIKASSGSMLLNIYKDNKWMPDITMMTLAVYVCQNCGYLEFYTSKQDGLAKLSDSTNWRKVK
jgi:predicted nucleic-acid-binding Zn-ribbon protein